jgi:hypothetical protein
MAAAGGTATATAEVLSSLVDALVAEPVSGLDAAALQARIVAVTPQVARLQGWLQVAAGQLAAVTGGSVAPQDGGRARSVAGWLADVQHSTAGAAGGQLRTARSLQRLPLVSAAVLAGVLTPAQAAVLTRLVDRIDEASLLTSQPQLVEVAAAMDPVQLGRWVAHQIATHCEPRFDEQSARARQRRFLSCRREADGALRGSFLLPAEDSEALLTVLEPLARRNDLGDDRTAGQRRADALVELCEQVLRHGQLPDAGGSRPQLSYVLPADWAAAQFRQAACTACGPRCPDHAARTTHHRRSPTRSTRPGPGTAGRASSRRARPPPGPDRRPGRASRRCCATQGSAGCCSPRPGRSAASSRCATPSPPRSAGRWPPAT